MNGRSANPLRLLLRLPLLMFVAWLAAGCGAPGDPQPPSPPVPVAVTDLAARQQGNGVQLTFTLPSRTVSGDRLAAPPAIEILRGKAKLNGGPDNKSFKLVYTIPGALADVYSAQGKIQFTDPISPEDLRANPGAEYAYRVRTRASKQKDSADSNMVVARLFPVADKIASLDARVTQDAIELSWPASSAVLAASAPISGESLAGYHVYRGELDHAAPLPSPSDLSQVKWKSPPVLLAPTQSNSYRDTLFEFGKSYLYFVRSIVIAEGAPLESDDSTAAIVTPRDTFPPAAPQNVVVVRIPGEDGSVVADLSWSINTESDLAGYRVYRSEKPGERGLTLTADLLQSPAFRDTSALSGKQYFYSVTAVDRAGNESSASEPAALDLSGPEP